MKTDYCELDIIIFEFLSFETSKYTSFIQTAIVTGLHVVVSRPLPGDAEPNNWTLVLEFVCQTAVSRYNSATVYYSYVVWV
jgi:hypothetical protein